MTEHPMAERVGPRTLRLERRLEHPPERVWRALTDPRELAVWLVAAAELEPRARRRGHAALGRRRVGHRADRRLAAAGGARLHVGRGRAASRSSASSLTADGDGTRVVLTHERIDSLSGFAAGWHAHLDMLEGAARRAPGRLAGALGRAAPALRGGHVGLTSSTSSAIVRTIR